MIGLDYRGVEVLAAYQPVPILNAGVVAKMDLADIRAPFLRGAAMVIGLALVLVTAGTVLFVRLTNPMVKHLTETEQRYQRIFCGAPVPIWEQDFSDVGEALQDLRKSGVAELEPYLADNPEALRQLVRQGPGQGGERGGVEALRRALGQAVRRLVRTESSSPPPSTSLPMKLQALWEGREALLQSYLSA